MINSMTKGSEGIPQAGDPETSFIDYPINEDKSMVMQVVSVSNGIVQAVKIWDESNTIATSEQFRAVLKFHGTPGTPRDNILEVGQHVVFHRVGDFNSGGTDGFELHKIDITKTSWVCFIEEAPIIFVRDEGIQPGDELTSGRQVELDVNGNFVPVPLSALLPFRVLDDATRYFQSGPPFLIGRVYAAKRIPNTSVPPDPVNEHYRVFLPGHGDTQKIFEISTGDLTFKLELDGSGHFVNFEVS